MTVSWVIHVVDDDDGVRASLLFALTAVGYRAAVYVDAGDFLARGQHERGVLVSDVRMPGMNGIELTRLLQQGGSTMPIILITGHANQALQAEALSAGATSVLEKPLALGALLAEITRVTTDWV